ncbi:Crp/Fnr family transcriptional regulator [Rhodocytophaga aerolata]|uniref:Crp/Fnr family transcriptional regulator n=1 Tax=Rhodocytophaga aerolata TaxID=455078 RepID=A0ABT8QY24_9BACT|nr:Crp/Fnr family transcriptional regulator [Rhodocytophaga aerolata]MDO1444734.1 Crp/Fnr family transcriptional regulator [Rhodocytophaga aerolata]
MLIQLKQFICGLVQPTEEEWEALACKLRPVTLKKKEHFLREGEVCTKYGFIMKGCVRLYFLVDGEEICKDLLFEKTFTGSLASFTLQKPAQFNVAAIEETSLLVIYRSDLLELFEKYTCWQKFGRLMAEGLAIRKEMREISFLKDSPEERYRKLLAEQPMVLQRVPLHYVASYLGMKPETLSRIRNRISRPAIS